MTCYLCCRTGIQERNRAPRGGATSKVNGRFYRGGQFMPTEAKPAAALFLTIKGLAYAVRPILVQDPEIRSAYIVSKPGGEPYAVARHACGCVQCDCPDYVFRRAGTGQTCKHGSALVEAGLI